MEQNDILKRRRTAASSGFRQGLLQDDYLPTRNNEQPYGYQPPTVVQGIAVSNQTRSNIPSHQQQQPSYNPPTSEENFFDHPTYYAQQQSLLYLTSPQPPSIRRAIISQTPARTAPYNSINDSLNRTKQQNPAEDLGAQSFCSYGIFCCQCVRTTEVGIVENCGRYQTLLEPGFYCLP